MKIKSLILGILSLFLAVNGFAQVVTPSLDPSMPVEAPSAVSWRIGSTFGGSFGYSKEDTQSTKKDYYYSDTSLLLAYQPGTVVSEFYWVPSNSMYEWDSTTDSLTKSGYSIGEFRVALRGENRVSVGIGYNTGSRNVPVSGVLTQIGTTSYEGSFSMRLMNRYYIAAGLRRNTDTYPSGDDIKSNIIYGGASAIFGDPLGTVFRTEASIILTPRATNINLTDVFQAKSTETSVGAEFVFRSILLSYRYRGTNYQSFNTSGQNKTEVSNQYGIGYKTGPFIFNLYANQTVETVENLSYQSDIIKLTFAYGFI